MVCIDYGLLDLFCYKEVVMIKGKLLCRTYF